MLLLQSLLRCSRRPQQQTQLLAAASLLRARPQSPHPHSFSIAAAKPRDMAATPENMAAVRSLVDGLAPVVCYHHPCVDGVFAALAAQNYFAARGVRPRFAPLSVFRDPQVANLGLAGNEVVYFLDYSGPAGFVQQLAGHCSRWV